ncbi:MAG: hypothetical protein WAM66_12610 [Acidobacteriaceae bacterium]
MRLAAAIFTLLTLPAFAQLPDAPHPGPAYPPPPPHVLTSADHKRLDIPMFGDIGNARCDASGDLFFDASSPFADDGPFLEVKADRERHLIFTLPQEENTPGNNLWTVTPDGTLYVLHDDFQRNKLVRFRSDGSVDGISSLVLPAHVSIQRMAISDSGVVFVSGYRYTQEEGAKTEPGFAAIFDADGNIIRDLSAGAPSYSTSGELSDGDLIAGDDGRFYVLGSDTVRVFNPSGEQAASLKITKPSAKAIAARIDEWQGSVSVLFYTEAKHKRGRAAPLSASTVVLNADSGDVSGIYTFDPALTNSVLCYNHAGYTMESVDHRMMALDTVPLQ